MSCPKCNSDETYRTSQQSLTVHCDSEALLRSADRCGYHWQVKQPLKPIVSDSVYSRLGAMKGKHIINVWYCPVNPNRYSFSLIYGGGLCVFREFDEDPYLSGSYATADEALDAGALEACGRTFPRAVQRGD